jgi:hypothetical protein
MNICPVTDECTRVTDIFKNFIPTRYFSLPPRTHNSLRLDSVFHSASPPTAASAPNDVACARAGQPSAPSSPSPVGLERCRPSRRSAPRWPHARRHRPHLRLPSIHPARPVPGTVVPVPGRRRPAGLGVHGLHGPGICHRGSRMPLAPLLLHAATTASSSGEGDLIKIHLPQMA